MARKITLGAGCFITCSASPTQPEDALDLSASVLGGTLSFTIPRAIQFL
jgi:hypothetical protein